MVNKIEQIALFFVLCKDEEALGNGNFKIFYKNNSEVNSLNQNAVWQAIIKGRDDGKNCPFWYFPRGRVQYIRNDSKKHYEIVINKALAAPAVIARIKKQFKITGIDVKISKDTSGEFDCVWDKDC